ncbi:hypothetical protein [uncultured Jannaschia sp.]|uniref:hypothetical protein n=1 Tax=uncultured Jannaschia sp. TaxID=293347 RepID=UPI002609A08B|nr:hypothetical protein [uncultured Jannaschia sp.]
MAYDDDYSRKPSYRLTYSDALVIWGRYRKGEFQNRIAADFDVNPARVNEVLKGKRFPGSEDAAGRMT